MEEINRKTKPKNTRRRWKSLAMILGSVVASVVFASCANMGENVIMAPPHTVEGATFVGTETCASCHEDVTEHFPGATHHRLRSDEGKDVSCESCHGPGSVHVETGGALQTITNPRKSPEVCFSCHLDKRGAFNLPHSHPVLEGKIACTDCHDSHSGDAVMGRGTDLKSQKDVCIQCHTAQAGPYAFEHQATEEGCTTCHQPHGSINNKMLEARNANLCLKCHFQRVESGQILIGNRNHNSFLPRGTCWTSGCHEGVHGSHNSPSLRY